jgi:hypothetical protein
MKHLFNTSIACLLTPTLVCALGQSAGMVQLMDAQVTTTDGNTEVISKVNINGSSDLPVYAKPFKIKSQSTTEILVEANPRLNSTKESLTSVKNIVFENKKLAYVYMENNTKHQFHEVKIDGKPYLMADGGKLHGKSADNKDRHIDLAIVEKISITTVYTKGEVVDGHLMCPIVK